MLNEHTRQTNEATQTPHIQRRLPSRSFDEQHRITSQIHRRHRRRLHNAILKSRKIFREQIRCGNRTVEPPAEAGGSKDIVFGGPSQNFSRLHAKWVQKDVIPALKETSR